MRRHWNGRGTVSASVRPAAALVLAVAFTLAAPVAALASSADTYVDDGGSDAGNDCSVEATPCKTIPHALSVTLANGTVHIADGTYPGGIFLSFHKLEGAGPGAIIDGGAGVAVTAQPASGISHLTLRSSTVAVEATATTTINANTFDSGNDESIGVRAQTSGDDGPVVISNNTFTGGGFNRTGVLIADQNPPQVIGNTMAGLHYGVVVAGGSPTIKDNTITGSGNTGILVRTGTIATEPLIEHNIVDGKDGLGYVSVYGIRVGQGAPADPAVGAHMSRNHITGNGLATGGAGIKVENTLGPVTSTSDLLTDNGFGIHAQGAGGSGGVAIRNLTDVDLIPPEVPFKFEGVTVSIDSSLVPQGFTAPGSTCTITNSSGPTTTGNSCQTFQTTAAPDYVNAAAGDFRLTGSASNLAAIIDHGDPLAPPAGALDLAGNTRAIAALVGCVPVRDMGAFEYVPPSPPAGCPPPPSTGSTPPPPATSKKCKKGRKLKKGKCVKKKKKRKK